MIYYNTFPSIHIHTHVRVCTPYICVCGNFCRYNLTRKLNVNLLMEASLVTFDLNVTTTFSYEYDGSAIKATAYRPLIGLQQFLPTASSVSCFRRQLQAVAMTCVRHLMCVIVTCTVKQIGLAAVTGK